MCDREGDMWEMFQKQSERQSTGLLVRVNRARHRKVVLHDGSEEDLQRYMEQLPVTDQCKVELAARGGRHAHSTRKVKLQVRVVAVQLLAPGSSGVSLPMIAVLAQESATPSNGSPLRWLLLCTEGEATADNALRILHWYRRRWVVEEFFRVLKSGIRIEERRFDEVKDLLKCLAFDAITAWRVTNRIVRLPMWCRKTRSLYCIFNFTSLTWCRRVRHRIGVPMCAPLSSTLGILPGFNPRSVNHYQELKKYGRQ